MNTTNDNPLANLEDFKSKTVKIVAVLACCAVLMACVYVAVEINATTAALKESASSYSSYGSYSSGSYSSASSASSSDGGAGFFLLCFIASSVGVCFASMALVATYLLMAYRRDQLGILSQSLQCKLRTQNAPKNTGSSETTTAKEQESAGHHEASSSASKAE